jgi:hypothetical protein
MAHFRADNIVRDAEDIKNALTLMPSDDADPRPLWLRLGATGWRLSSHARTCSDHVAPRHLFANRRDCAHADTVPIASTRSDLGSSERSELESIMEMYPWRYCSWVKKTVQTLIEKPVTLPSGSELRARRFLQIGMSLGGSPSSFANIHRLLSNAFVNPDDDSALTRAFLKVMDSEQPFDDHPDLHHLDARKHIR